MRPGAALGPQEAGEAIILWNGSMRMDAKNKARFKKVLLEERQRIMNMANKPLDDIQVNTDDLADETDQAVSELSQNLSLTLRDRERSSLAAINSALGRIEDGTFGQCEVCEEPIEPRRLEARPMSTMCFACQEEKEHKQKLFA